MKKMKKLVSVMLAMVMAIGMTTNAWATETTAAVEGETAETFGTAVEPNYTTSVGEFKITLDNAQPGHTYVAYQIFDADYSADGSGVMSNVQWGDGVDGVGLLANLKELKAGESVRYTEEMAADIREAFANCKTAFEVSKALEGLNTDLLNVFADVATAHVNEAGAHTADKETYVIEGLDYGYYLIVDVDCPNTILDISEPMLVNVDGDVDKDPKDVVPEVNKLVLEEDYNIGDVVTFELHGTVPADIKKVFVTHYTYVFHDTLSEGLTLLNNEEHPIVVSFVVDGERVVLDPMNRDGTTITVNYDIETTGNGLKVDFNNLLDVFANNPEVAGATDIVVAYDAVLNEKAVMGPAGNPNEVYLEYSNNPQNVDNTKTTTTDLVEVYTFGIDVLKMADKKDENGNDIMLSGAEFVLMNNDGQYYSVDAAGAVSWIEAEADAVPENATKRVSNAAGELYFYGVDSGTYYLIETKAPLNYAENKNPIEVVLTAEYNDVDADGDRFLSAFNGNEETGTVEVSVENTMNTTSIPETGGMGTTLFYAIGGMLTVGAAAVYVTRKRVGEAE